MKKVVNLSGIKIALKYPNSNRIVFYDKNKQWLFLFDIKSEVLTLSYSGIWKELESENNQIDENNIKIIITI